MTDEQTGSPLPDFTAQGDLSETGLKVKLVESDVANILLLVIEAEPTRLNRARITDNHV